MVRVANIPPVLKGRMCELGLQALQDLAERAEIPGDTIKGDRRFSLTNGLAILEALNYELDSEALLLLQELAGLYHV